MSKSPYHSTTNKEKYDEKHEGNQSVQPEQNAVENAELRHEGEGTERLQKRGKDERKELFGCEVVQVKDKARRKRAMRSPYDVNGSYTGTPADGGKPVQDADDL